MRLGLRSTLAVVIAGSFAAPLAAQSPQAGGPPPRMTLKSSIDLVPVDVTVVDRSGRPVPNLPVDDFKLTIDGRSRKLSSAEFVSIPAARTPPVQAGDYSSNEGVEGGRLIVLAVDAGSLAAGRGKSALAAAGRFLDGLNPADRVALVTLPGGDPQRDFTSNHALVKSLVQKIAGQAQNNVSTRLGLAEALAIERGDETMVAQVLEQQCTGDITLQSRDSCLQQLTSEANLLLADMRQRSRHSIAALKSLFDRLSSSETPKTIVLVSGGVLLNPDYTDVAWIGPRASAAHVALYILQIDTPDADIANGRTAATRNQDTEALREGLDVMAGMARGEVFRVVSNADTIFQRLALELSGYYLLSFEPLPGDRDDKPHKISIDVRKKNVEVRARREFTVPAATTAAARDDLLDTLRAPLLATDIPLKLTTYAFRDTGTAKIRVVVAANIDRSSNQDDDVSIGYVVIDEQGKAVAQQVERRVTSAISPRTKGQKFLGAAVVQPGGYTIKLAAVDNRGRRGSVERAFRAEMKSVGRIRVTDLIVADNSEPGSSGLTPTVDATFSGDEVQAYLELFDEASGSFEDAAVSLEIADRANSRALASASARLESPDGNGAHRVAQGGLPIALLPSGDYLARAIVTVGGQPVGDVTRPFRIVREAKVASTTPASAASATIRPAAAPTAMPTRPEPFDRGSVLTAPVLGFFLDRLRTAAANPGAVGPAVEEIRGGKFAEALETLQKAGGDQLATPFLEGLVLLAKGELNPAANKFRDALRIDSEFYPAVFYLGACYAAGGRDREAAGAWQTSLVPDSSAPFAYAFLGDALLRLRDVDQAIDVLTEGRSRWPDDTQIAARLETALAMKKRLP
jgi:VWFA-related protein